ncbi:putative nucleic acid binding protein [Luteococcus japonicus]|uniref:Putative nucleic acid binding protein n=1 Tax=Luteococcus japonicus TaxID=33984 RepID=A0A3N1ZW18_9ACTN|nr:hypothetical protein [Luteococcus japonicus]ROR55053.1 putative nucleic acid binding protein [Luteococcus japonicus]
MTTPPNQPSGFNPPSKPNNVPQQGFQQQGDQYPGQPQPGQQQYAFGQPAAPGMPPMDPKAQAKAAKAYAKATRPWFQKKRFWALGLLLLLIIGSALGGGSDTPAKPKEGTVAAAPKNKAEAKAPAEQQKEAEVAAPAETVLVVTADKLIQDLEKNALKANSTYKDKLVTVTGRVRNIDAQGDYFTVRGTDEYTLTNIQIFINEEQKALVSEFSEGQTVTATGRVSDVGEFLGYSIKADTIK